MDPSAEVGSVEPTDESRGLLRGGGAGTGASASPLFDETVSVRPFHPLLVPTRIKVNIISKSLFNCYFVLLSSRRTSIKMIDT